MPTCGEMCPIAQDQNQRKEENGQYSRGEPYVTITTVAYGIFVTALENDEYPGVTSTQVASDAKPSCNLANRLTQWMHKVGASGAHENCVYVPGKRAWITISRKSSPT